MGNEASTQCSTHYDGAEECGIGPDNNYSSESCGCEEYVFDGIPHPHMASTYCRQNYYDQLGAWCCDCQCEPGYQCTLEELGEEECNEAGFTWECYPDLNYDCECRLPDNRRLEIEPRDSSLGKDNTERVLKKSKKHRSKTEKQAAAKKNLFESVKAATTLMCMHAVAPPSTKYVLKAKIITSIAGTMSFDIRCGEDAKATMHGQTEFLSDGISSPKKHTLAFNRGGEFELSQRMSCPNDERISIVVTESTAKTVGLALDWPTCEGGSWRMSLSAPTLITALNTSGPNRICSNGPIGEVRRRGVRLWGSATLRSVSRSEP